MRTPFRPHPRPLSQPLSTARRGEKDDRRRRQRAVHPYTYESPLLFYTHLHQGEGQGMRVVFPEDECTISLTWGAISAIIGRMSNGVLEMGCCCVL